MTKIKNFPKNLKEIFLTLQKNDFQAFLVGGCVRDFFLGRDNKDYDIATDAIPKDVISLFEKDYTIVTDGMDFGVIKVVRSGETYEIATFREESSYKDSRRPSEVKYTNDITKDLARRDFTINALAFNPFTEEILDPFGGAKDLKRKKINCVGHPQDRFQEDALRILRALRFAIQLNFSIEMNTFNQLMSNKNKLQNISSERKRDELIKSILDTNYNNEKYFNIIYQLLFNKTLKTSIHDVEKDLNTRLSKLFIEERSINKTRTLLKEFKFTNKTIKSVLSTIIFSQKEIYSSADQYQIRRLISRIGHENALRVLKLQDFNKRDNIFTYNLVKNDPLFLKDLKISGGDLIQMNIDPKKIGSKLNDILDKVLENPSLNNREKLLKLLQEK